MITNAIESALSGDRGWLGMSKSSIITNEEAATDLLSPVTPGELLKEEFLVPMGISQYRPSSVPLLWPDGWLLAARADGV